MRRVYLGPMVGALVSLGLGAPAHASDRVEPLNQYIVKGTDAELEQLGALGYDVTEGADAAGSSWAVKSRRTPRRPRTARARRPCSTAPSTPASGSRSRSPGESSSTCS